MFVEYSTMYIVRRRTQRWLQQMASFFRMLHFDTRSNFCLAKVKTDISYDNFLVGKFVAPFYQINNE